MAGSSKQGQAGRGGMSEAKTCCWRSRRHEDTPYPTTCSSNDGRLFTAAALASSTIYYADSRGTRYVLVFTLPALFISHPGVVTANKQKPREGTRSVQKRQVSRLNFVAE